MFKEWIYRAKHEKSSDSDNTDSDMTQIFVMLTLKLAHTTRTKKNSGNSTRAAWERAFGAVSLPIQANIATTHDHANPRE